MENIYEKESPSTHPLLRRDSGFGWMRSCGCRPVFGPGFLFGGVIFRFDGGNEHLNRFLFGGCLQRGGLFRREFEHR